MDASYTWQKSNRRHCCGNWQKHCWQWLLANSLVGNNLLSFVGFGYRHTRLIAQKETFHALSTKKDLHLRHLDYGSQCLSNPLVFELENNHECSLYWPSAALAAAAFDDDAGSISLGRGDATGGKGWLRVRPREFLFAKSDSLPCVTPSNGDAAR